MKKISFFEISLTFAGCFLGAGFISGQELRQYFTLYGLKGIAGLFLSMLLLCVISVFAGEITRRTGFIAVDRILVKHDIPWLRDLTGAVIMLLFFIVTGVMFAGIAAMGQDMLSMPRAAVCAVTVFLACLVTYYGLDGMVRMFCASVPVLIAATFIIAAVRLYGTGLSAVCLTYGNTNPLLGNWASSAVNYTALNIFGSVGILAPVAARAGSSKAAAAGMITGTVWLLIAALGIILSQSTSKAAMDAELPMLTLSGEIGTFAKTVYAALMFLAMFGNAISSMVAVMTYLNGRSARIAANPGLSIAVFGVLLFISGLFGFSNLVSTLYPVFGYIGILVILMIVLRRITLS